MSSLADRARRARNGSGDAAAEPVAPPAPAAEPQDVVSPLFPPPMLTVAPAAATTSAAPTPPAPTPPATTPPAAVVAAAGRGGLAQRTVDTSRVLDDDPAGRTTAPVDPLAQLKERVVDSLYERLGARLNDPNLNEQQLHDLVRTELAVVVSEELNVALNAEQRQRLIRDVQDDVIGYGPLERLLADPDVSEVMVNGPETIFVERKGQLTKSPARFVSETQLRRVIERIVSRVGRRIDESSPLVDARLADGSRVNAVIPPVAFSGSSLTIRKFSKDPFKVADLIRFGTMSEQMAEMLKACVEARLNIIVSGGTGSGKTTLLNVLSGFIPEEERIVTIEDAVELQLQQEHLVRLESRPANIEGRGEINIRDLVKNSLRMRPDRIVIGECRSGEALDMLQAMNTGHDGSLSTVHSNSPRDAIARLETLVLMAGMDLPLAAIRQQIASAVDVIIQLSRLRDGTRRITAVTEVQGMEGSIVTMQDVFVFDYAAGVGEDGKFLGTVIPTGIRPKFTDKFTDMGIQVDPSVFQLAEAPAQRKAGRR